MLIQIKDALICDLGILRFGIIKVGPFAMDQRDEVIATAQENACATCPDFAMLTRITGELVRDPQMMNPNAFGHYGLRGVQVLGRRAGKNFALINDGKMPTEV